MGHGDAFETNLSPHGTFSLVAGLYVAAVLAPAATAVLVGGGPIWRTYATLLGTAAATAVVAGLAVSRAETRVAVGLGRTSLVRVLPLAGFAYAGWVVVGADDSIGLAMLGLLGGLFAGLIVVPMARNRAIRDRIAGVPVRARWSAQAGPRRRRLAKVLAVVLVGGGLLAFVTGIVVDVRPVLWAGQLAIPVGAGVLGTTAEREYAVIDEGLVVRAPATLRLVPWDRFESVTVTDEAVSIRRSAPWRLAVSCDREAIDDVPAVRGALSRYLHDEQR